MPKSKNRKNHSIKLNQYKSKKTMSTPNQQTQPGAQQLPPYQSIPTWSPDADIAMKGFEFEALVNSANEAYAAFQKYLQVQQAIMSRNLLNGNVGMEFRKLKKDLTGYEDMTEEEKAPLRKDFTDYITKAREQQASAEKAKQEATDQLPTSPGTPAVVEKPAKVKKVKAEKATEAQEG